MVKRLLRNSTKVPLCSEICWELRRSTFLALVLNPIFYGLLESLSSRLSKICSQSVAWVKENLHFSAKNSGFYFYWRTDLFALEILKRNTKDGKPFWWNKIIYFVSKFGVAQVVIEFKTSEILVGPFLLLALCSIDEFWAEGSQYVIFKCL